MIDSDYYFMNKETACDVQYLLVTKQRKLIPRKIDPDPVMFFKITYILPMLTIGLVVYYMTVVKKQKISEIKIPKQLPNVG